MVVQLGPELTSRLRGLKACEQCVPSPGETQSFWEEVEGEERAGRSLKGYVVGWTAKLLTDIPGHQAALWLRLAGMVRGTLRFQPEEFLDHAERLAADRGDDAACLSGRPRVCLGEWQAWARSIMSSTRLPAANTAPDWLSTIGAGVPGRGQNAVFDLDLELASPMAARSAMNWDCSTSWTSAFSAFTDPRSLRALKGGSSSASAVLS
jgi:hypothetical protein